MNDRNRKQRKIKQQESERIDISTSINLTEAKFLRIEDQKCLKFTSHKRRYFINVIIKYLQFVFLSLKVKGIVIFYFFKYISSWILMRMLINSKLYHVKNVKKFLAEKS